MKTDKGASEESSEPQSGQCVIRQNNGCRETNTICKMRIQKNKVRK
jgi:hypothetical protein